MFLFGTGVPLGLSERGFFTTACFCSDFLVEYLQFLSGVTRGRGRLHGPVLYSSVDSLCRVSFEAAAGSAAF